MAIKIPTIGPEQQIGGSVPLTMQPRDLTYSGLALPKSGVGENLKLLAGAGEKFANDLTKVQMQIKKDQDEATLLDLQNTIAQEDLSIFASLVDPDNPDNAMGSNATDSRFNQLTQQRKQTTTAAINGEFTGIYAEYADRLSNLSRTSQLAFTKYMLTNNISFETKLVSHFSEQATAYKTQALETDILRLEQALPTDATAFDANIKNLTLKIAGLLKYQGLYSDDNVQTQLHDKFSVGVHDTIMGMLARGDVAGAEEFYKTYVKDKGYVVVPEGDDGTKGITAVLKGAHKTAIDGAIAAKTEEIGIEAGYNAILNMPDQLVGDKLIPAIDDRVGMRDLVNSLIGQDINGVTITEELAAKIHTRINEHHTAVSQAYTQDQRNKKLAVQKWIQHPDNKGKIMPPNITAGLDVPSMNEVHKYQRAFEERRVGGPLVSNFAKLNENWFSKTPRERREMSPEDFAANVLAFADTNDKETLAKNYNSYQEKQETQDLANLSAQVTAAKKVIADQNSDAKTYFEKQLTTRKDYLARAIKGNSNTTAAKNMSDQMIAQYEMAIRREFYERASNTDAAAMSFEQVDKIIDDFSLGLSLNREGDRIGEGIVSAGFQLDMGTLITALEMPVGSVEKGEDIEKAQASLMQFHSRNRYEVVSLYNTFTKSHNIEANLEDLSEFATSLDTFLLTEADLTGDVNMIGSALKEKYETKTGDLWEDLSAVERKNKIMRVIAKSIHPMDIVNKHVSLKSALASGQKIDTKSARAVYSYIMKAVSLKQSPAFRSRAK
tara:strand:- start:809 stop:3142 length:2334 start_codon:yes stop_codon:yes gene_type:complete